MTEISPDLGQRAEPSETRDDEPTAHDQNGGPSLSDGGRSGEGAYSESQLGRYRSVMAVYAGVVIAGVSVASRRESPGRSPNGSATTGQVWGEVVLTGVATYKLSRLLSKQTVTTPLRAPFTEHVGPAGPAEVNTRPVGTGWRRSVGELLSCPFCLDVWIATLAMVGQRFAPRFTRLVLSIFAAVGLADLLQFVYVALEHQAEAPSGGSHPSG